MTVLTDSIAAQIDANGPISVSEFMQIALLHPEHGYYATRDPLGAAGDFTTAPEISQMFGELLGLCLAETWVKQGAPGRITLAELGPGRGTLMADILRATQRVPGFHAAMHLHLVEVSPPLRTLQERTIGRDDITWHEDCGTLPADAPLFVVANEFFDALPIRQYRRAGEMWRERMVGMKVGRELIFGQAPPAPVPALAHRLEDTREGDLVEVCPQAATVARLLGRRIAAKGGAALIVDYGDWRSQGDTFQAVKGHAPVHPLEAPGEADLTAHVDFEQIARAAPCAHSRLTPQGVFLERLGITARAQALAKALEGSDLDALVAAHRRLTNPVEMGTLFKVMALYPVGAAPPPGLDA
jgi:NADH dehydrogenase [ubiquinone] 1 alpha subcomplex assembly factor 7